MQRHAITTDFILTLRKTWKSSSLCWKITGYNHGVYFHFFYWVSLLSLFQFLFIYFALLHPHSALLVVDNWTVVDGLISRSVSFHLFRFVFFLSNFLSGCLFFHSCSSATKKLVWTSFNINQLFNRHKGEIANFGHTRYEIGKFFEE